MNVLLYTSPWSYYNRFLMIEKNKKVTYRYSLDPEDQDALDDPNDGNMEHFTVYDPLHPDAYKYLHMRKVE